MQVALTVGSPIKHGSEKCKISLLNVSDGIRLWHFAEALRKLRWVAGVRPCRKDCVGHRVSAHLIGTRLSLVGPSDEDSGDLE